MSIEIRECGECSCGTPVLKIINSEIPTCQVDGIRYSYPDEAESGWCIFRCKVCGEVIDEVWTESEAP